MEAPSGTFCFTGEEAESVVLIAGGVGVTPMMSVARYLTHVGWPGEIYLILGFRAPRDFIFQTELAELGTLNPRLRVTVIMSRPGLEPWSGAVGHVDATLLSATVPHIATRRVHLCGPPAMMDAVRAELAQLGVPRAQVRMEAFGTVMRDPGARGATSTEVAGQASFEVSGTKAPVHVGATILDAAEGAGVFIDSACRSGTCGTCRIKLVSGRVRMAVQDSLTDRDEAEGYILACQAQVEGDVIVES
jgi:ferredoxin-NADP reductase